MKSFTISKRQEPGGGAIKGGTMLFKPVDFLIPKEPDRLEKASTLFSTEKRGDGWLVCVNWWHGDEQQSRPVSGPYDTEQEAEAKAKQLTERQAAKRPITAIVEGNDE